MSGSLRTPSRLRLCWRLLLTLALLPALTVPATAAVPANPETRARVVGQPVALVVQPEAIALSGPRSTLQILVTGRYADGSVRDLTHFCDLTLEQAGVALLDEERFLTPLKDGTTTLVVRAGNQTTRVSVSVKDFSQPHPVSFRNDLI